MTEQTTQSGGECCPLCLNTGVSLFHQDNNKRSQRPYYRCHECALVFVPQAYYLSAAEEKAEYDLHENQLADVGYGRFLNRLWAPYKACFSAQPVSSVKLLEFGCGPGPLLAQMMEQDGFKVSLYDHFYYPDTQVLKPAYYHGVSATEVIEHVFEAKKVFERWLSYLAPGGQLAIMTKLVKDQSAFANWHYKNDLTHVNFYSVETFEWLAKRYGLKLDIHGADVMIFST